MVRPRVLHSGGVSSLISTMKISTTPHALQRFAERGGRIIKELAEQAYHDGKELTQEEQQIMFEKGIFGDQYWGSTYKKYRGLIWVFRNKKGKLILLTVLYPHFLTSPFANFQA